MYFFTAIQMMRKGFILPVSDDKYLLCSLYGKELVLSFCTAHIPKRPVVGHVSGDEGDFIHHVLMLNHLSDRDIDLFSLHSYDVLSID